MVIAITNVFDGHVFVVKFILILRFRGRRNKWKRET